MTRPYNRHCRVKTPAGLLAKRRRKVGENSMFIDAIMWYFGMNKSQATQYYKELLANGETYRMEEILRGYQNQCKLAFYND